MAPGALDVCTKEMVYLAVSVSNGCEYCIASHGAAARKAGMTDAMFGELMAVVGMANETNRLANGYRVPVDPAFERRWHLFHPLRQRLAEVAPGHDGVDAFELALVEHDRSASRAGLARRSGRRTRSGGCRAGTRFPGMRRDARCQPDLENVPGMILPLSVSRKSAVMQAVPAGQRHHA